MPSFPCQCSRCICGDQYDCYENYCRCCAVPISDGHRYRMGKMSQGKGAHDRYSELYYRLKSQRRKLGGPLRWLDSETGTVNRRKLFGNRKNKKEEKIL